MVSLLMNGELQPGLREPRLAWGAVFFLLTTDILGQFSVPFAILFPQVEKMLTFLDGPLPKLDMDLGGHYTRSLARLQASKMPKLYFDCPCA
jgi:hypothetical protein